MRASVLVRDYMSAPAITLSPETRMLDAIHLLVAQRISGAPVVDERGNVVGMLTERDCLSVAVHSSYHAEARGRVSEYMSAGAETVDADSSIVDVAHRFMRLPYRRYPVMHHQQLVGIVSRRDVLRALLRGS